MHSRVSWSFMMISPTCDGPHLGVYLVPACFLRSHLNFHLNSLLLADLLCFPRGFFLHLDWFSLIFPYFHPFLPNCALKIPFSWTSLFCCIFVAVCGFCENLITTCLWHYTKSQQIAVSRIYPLAPCAVWKNKNFNLMVKNNFTNNIGFYPLENISTHQTACSDISDEYFPNNFTVLR